MRGAIGLECLECDGREGPAIMLPKIEKGEITQSRIRNQIVRHVVEHSFILINKLTVS